MNRTFPKTARLLTRSDFQYVFDAPEKRSSDRYFTLLGRSRTQAGTRLGLIIAKRRILRAHERNRVKRLVRESFRTNAQLPQDTQLILLAKSAAQHADNATLFTSLARHWQRLKQ